jgi:hypothetical protein
MQHKHKIHETSARFELAIPASSGPDLSFRPHGHGDRQFKTITDPFRCNHCKENNFGRCILFLGDSPVSEFYVLTFQNALSHLHRWCKLTLPMKMEQSVPKRQHIKFRHRRITQKKQYNVQNTA